MIFKQQRATYAQVVFFLFSSVFRMVAYRIRCTPSKYGLPPLAWIPVFVVSTTRPPTYIYTL